MSTKKPPAIRVDGGPAHDMKKVRAPLSESVRVDLARTALLTAALNLDDEGFNALAWMIYQQSTHAGGFKDHEGWLRVREAAERLPIVADWKKKFDEASQREDEKPPTVVQGIK